MADLPLQSDWRIIIVYAAIKWVMLTDPSGGQLSVNGDTLASLRDIHIDATGQYRLVKTGDGIPNHCLLGLGNGRFAAVMETCDEIREMLQ